MSAWIACYLALAGAVQADTVQKTFELREWVVDYQRPTTEPRRMPFDVPTADKMLAMLANNAFPGPAIEAFVGDEIEVTVVNLMLAQQVDFSWEGVEVTQAAAEPIVQQGANFTYKMVAQKAGTFWWHATLPVQAAQGLKGAIVVRARDDPAAQSYQDEQVVVLSDASQAPGLCLSPPGTSSTGCSEIDKATLNGQWGDGSKDYPYPVVDVQRGNCYRLRWLGMQSQASTFEVGIQSHTVKLVGQGTAISSFPVSNGASIDTILCADQNPGFFSSKDYKINFIHHGKTTKRFQAILRYSKSATPGQPDLNV